MNMTCSSDGLPAPKILWRRQLNNGELQFLSENTTLTLISTKMEDSGIYVCEGINQAGKSRKEVELTIQGEQSVINELLLLVLFLLCYWFWTKSSLKTKFLLKKCIEDFEEL